MKHRVNVYVRSRLWCRSDLAAAQRSFLTSAKPDPGGRLSNHDWHGSRRWLRGLLGARRRDGSQPASGAVPDDLVDAVDDARSAVAAEEQRQHDVQSQSLAFGTDRLRWIGDGLFGHLVN